MLDDFSEKKNTHNIISLKGKKLQILYGALSALEFVGLTLKRQGSMRCRIQSREKIDYDSNSRMRSENPRFW